MEHELRVDAELLRKAEACGIILAVRGKLSCKTNERAIQPAHDIGNVFSEAAVHSQTRHQHGGSLLIEGLRYGCVISSITMPTPACGGNTQVEAPVRSLVGCQILDIAPFVCRQWCRVGVCHLKEKSNSCGWIYASQIPRGCSTATSIKLQ